MKTIVCFENEERPCLYNARTLQEIRRIYPDDYMILVSAGDFAADGTRLIPCGRDRSAAYVKAGADLILTLSTASILGGFGKKEFAGAALVQNLRTAHLLVIPCTPLPGQTAADCGKALRSYAMLMFTESSGYRSRLSEHLNHMPFRAAQARTVCECIPEAEELLSCPENRQALWMLDAMLQLYFMTKVEFIAAPECIFCEAERISNEAEPAESDYFEKTAALQATNLVANSSMESLIDIAGSTPQMAIALLENCDRIQNAGSLREIMELLTPAPSDRARLFLLKAILGIRKIHMQICGLHTFVPYAYISAKNPEKQDCLDQLQQQSWVPLIGDSVREQAVNADYSYLLQADKKAESLIHPAD